MKHKYAVIDFWPRSVDKYLRTMDNKIWSQVNDELFYQLIWMQKLGRRSCE